MQITEIKTQLGETTSHTFVGLSMRRADEYKKLFRALGYTNVIQEDADVWMYDHGSCFGQYEFRKDQ